MLVPAFAQSQSHLEVNKTPKVISGQDTTSGVQFRSELLASGREVVVDMYFGNKQIHADIDYGRRRVVIKSTFVSNGAPATMPIEDIWRFQKLLQSLPPLIGANTQHADALGSLVNLIASVPRDKPIDFNLAPPATTYDSICGQIGQQSTATYKLCVNVPTCKKTDAFTTYNQQVIVGPACYVPPALGRCGQGGGPDPVIGLVQRFTQQCLNHDQCCQVTGDRYQTIYVPGIGNETVDVCGRPHTEECEYEIHRAVGGFLFAPDCGTTEGEWTDNSGYVYTLTGGDGSGKLETFTGTVATVGLPECPTWKVDGTRKGKTISLTAENLRSERKTCAGSFRYVGRYSDCSAASGTWTNDSGRSGTWSWTRDGIVPPVTFANSPAANAHSPAAK